MAPKESLFLHLKLYPTRTGTSRLYVTFTSDEIASLTQTVRLEILREPIKIPAKVEMAEAKKETPAESLAAANDQPSSSDSPNSA